jgi:hypothetical protein
MDFLDVASIANLVNVPWIMSQLYPYNGLPEFLGVQYSDMQQLLEGLHCAVQLVRTSLL